MRCTDKKNKSDSEIECIIVTTYESKILTTDTTLCQQVPAPIVIKI